eukprot:TCONS_00010879-protein
MSTKISWLFLLVTFYVFTESEGHSKEDTNVMGGLLQDHLREKTKNRAKRSLTLTEVHLCDMGKYHTSLKRCRNRLDKLYIQCRITVTREMECGREYTGSRDLKCKRPTTQKHQIHCCDLRCAF